MALNAKEGQEMIDACRKANVKLLVGYRMHFEPKTLEIIRMRKEGELGKITVEIALSHAVAVGDGRECCIVYHSFFTLKHVVCNIDFKLVCPVESDGRECFPVPEVVRAFCLALSDTEFSQESTAHGGAAIVECPCYFLIDRDTPADEV